MLTQVAFLLQLMMGVCINLHLQNSEASSKNILTRGLFLLSKSCS